MSASTENLIEQIASTEAAIRLQEAAKADVTDLKRDLKRLQKKLAQSNDALTEGKQILKG